MLVKTLPNKVENFKSFVYKAVHIEIFYNMHRRQARPGHLFPTVNDMASPLKVDRQAENLNIYVSMSSKWRFSSRYSSSLSKSSLVEFIILTCMPLT